MPSSVRRCSLLAGQSVRFHIDLTIDFGMTWAFLQCQENISRRFLKQGHNSLCLPSHLQCV
jgi:hypothetical protein